MMYDIEKYNDTVNIELYFAIAIILITVIISGIYALLSKK